MPTLPPAWKQKQIRKTQICYHPSSPLSHGSVGMSPSPLVACGLFHNHLQPSKPISKYPLDPTPRSSPALPVPPLIIETESDQKDLDPLIPSAYAAAEEPEASAHDEPVDENEVEADEGSVDLNNMLIRAQALLNAQAAASKQVIIAKTEDLNT